MSKTSQSAEVRFKRNTYLRWWQVRPIEFSLFLFPLIIQRVLLLVLYISAATYADQEDITIHFAMDATYAGIHAPTAVKHIIILGWILLTLAAVSAYLERCYKWPKAALVFAGLTALMMFLTLNTMAVYEPYLAVRR